MYLAAFDARRLYLKAGYPSLFAWLTDHLHLAKASAYRRMTAARLYARMPAVVAYLREGRLSLTKLCLLKAVLAPDNGLAVLEQAAAMTEQEVEELAVVLDPRRPSGPPRDTIRPVAPPPLPSIPQPDLFAAARGAGPAATPARDASGGTGEARPPVARPGAKPSHPEVRHEIKMNVGKAFMALLEEARAQLSHAHPGASLEVVLGECVKAALTAWRRRSRAETDHPRTTRRAAPHGRTIPAPVRRTVWKRDGGRCTFVSDGGRRCTATHRLQLHHDQPFALGGSATVSNIRLLCRTHNDLMARVDFGDAHMDRFTR